MISGQMIRDKLQEYERRGLFGKNAAIKGLSHNFIAKARHNLETAKVMLELSESRTAKNKLGISQAYVSYDWVIVCAYYAMYHAAMGALAAIGYKSEDHEATRIGLLHHYALEGSLEKKYITTLEKGRKLEEEYIQKLYNAKRTRQLAQYSVESEFSKIEAKKLVDDATAFVNRISELL